MMDWSTSPYKELQIILVAGYCIAFMTNPDEMLQVWVYTFTISYFSMLYIYLMESTGVNKRIKNILDHFHCLTIMSRNNFF